MNLTFTEEQEILRKFAKDFMTEKLPKKVLKELEKTEDGYSKDMWKEMADLGWIGLPFPDKYGGSDMSFMDLAVLLEEMGKAALPGPYLPTVVLGGMTILKLGTEEQKKEYLPKISSGQMVVTMAIDEADKSITTPPDAVKAAKEGGSWVIEGTKMFVPYAQLADYIICVARTSGKAGSEEGISIFIVDAKDPAVTCNMLETLVDKHCEVIFNKVKVPESNVIGPVDKAWKDILSIIKIADVAKCCEMAGMAQQVLDMTVDYAKERKQFNKPIGTFQIIQHYCADLFINVEGIKMSAYQAAWKLSEGMDFEEEISWAKTFAVQAADQIMALSHQVHGAIGVTMEYDLHFYTRRLKSGELNFGDRAYYTELIAGNLGL